MRVAVEGTAVEAIAALKFYLRDPAVGYAVVERGQQDFLVTIDYYDDLVIDGVDSELERHIINCISELTNVPIMLARAGGVQSDKEIRVMVPRAGHAYVALGIFRGLLKTGHHTAPARKWLGVFALLLSMAVPAFGQSTSPTSPSAGGVGGGGLTDTELRATPVPVSGTFWPVTQPVSIAASVAVTGTFWQATQPVSGTVAVSNLPASQAVTGTFWQATQPVSGTFWQATQPVSGTFWQATQPISGTVTVTDGAGALNVIVDSSAAIAVTGPLTDTQLRATPVPVSGTVTVTDGAGALNVIVDSSAAIAVTGPLTDAQLRASAVPVSGTFFQATQPVSIAAAVTVTPPTLTKGTQGATGFSTQDLKDAGRVAKSFYANAVASGTTGTETLITLTQSSGTGATSSVTTYTVTSGKTFRIQQIMVGSRGHVTGTVQITTFNIRMNTAGACVVTSTPILMGVATSTPATSLAWDRAQLTLPDGYEIAGNGTIAICISANAVFVTNAPTWFVNIIGYEY